jgi:uncharacterized membrane protein YgcG/tetratricopeptide (TPR) repeat protein
MMQLSKLHKRTFRLFFATAILALLFSSALSRAQETGVTTPLPQRTGRVNDYAGVLTAEIKERLENWLANLRQRSKIEFVVVTVKTTGGKDIYDYSLQLAREWKMNSTKDRDNSLLLVVSTEDGKFFTQQFSRSFRTDLPDGLIGEMGNRMRVPIGKGNYGEALTYGVQTFITQMAEKRGFSTEAMDQAPPPSVVAETPKLEKTDSLPTVTEANNSPAKEAEAPAKKPVTEKPATEVTPPSETATDTSAAKRPRTVREVFTKESSTKEPATKEPAIKEPATKTVVVSRDVPEKAELDAALTLPATERIEKLKAFMDAHPRSPLKTFASELLVSAHAALGDEKLQAGDAVGGVAEFNEAIVQIPDKMSDALFVKVVSQIPTNLYLRGQRSTSVEAARLIEAKVKDDPKRLLALAGFYLSVERADDAGRVSELAIQLAPEMAAAHQSLAASRHIALRLDDAASEYARALELDPKLTAARRSLADLRRAAGKAEAALALYREQLAVDPTDKTARAGVVLSLFDLGKREEAEREMEAALKDDPKNLAILVGVSYWYAAHHEATRAQEFATRAIAIEPRYTWSHIALARSLIAQNRPLEAERLLRFARAYGNFPTLDYELAGALAAAGFYEEAAAELARSFTIKDGQIETRLAGRTPAHATNFIELLADERRAGIFQSTPADTEANARMLKGLLALNTALDAAEGERANVNTSLLTIAREDFLAGDDAMRAFRQLYMATRLLRGGVELPSVVGLAEAATSGVEAALDAPTATVAVMAEELRDARVRAIGAGTVLTVNQIRRSVLANILRGRIEDLIGWSLFNQDKTAEAITHLRRAISVLPENSVWWRASQWHLGASLEAAGNQQEALAAYLKSYNPAEPDPVRRAIIETLYRKVNGSLEGLDAKIGPAPSVSSNMGGNTGSAPPQATRTAAPQSEQPKTENNEQKPAGEQTPAKQP